MDNVNLRVGDMLPYQPGKPVEELARELGITDAIKLASNENPRGPGARVLQTLSNLEFSRYPDGSGFRLKELLAARLGVCLLYTSPSPRD